MTFFFFFFFLSQTINKCVMAPPLAGQGWLLGGHLNANFMQETGCLARESLRNVPFQAFSSQGTAGQD